MTLPRTEVTTIREKAEVQATSKLLHSLKKIKLIKFMNQLINQLYQTKRLSSYLKYEWL